MRFFFRIPINAALRTFEGARAAIGRFVKLIPSKTPIPTSWSSTGLANGIFEVAENGEAWIEYYASGNSLKDARTLIHEYWHYLHWVLHRRPIGSAYTIFFEEARKLEQETKIFDKLADMIISLAE